MVLSSTSVGLIFTFCSLMLGYLGYNVARRKDFKQDKQEIKQETKEDVTIVTTLINKVDFLEREIESLKSKDNPTLEYIKNGIDEIKTQIRDIQIEAKEREEKTNDKISILNEKYNDLSIKYAEILASFKSEHKRLDEHDNKINDIEKERK